MFVGLILASSAYSQSGQVFTFSNNTPITINDNSTATPYASEISVAGFPISFPTRIGVRLKGFTHSFPDDVDILLVGPLGQRSIIMSDAGGGTDANGLTLYFDSLASGLIPDDGALTSNAYLPGNYLSGSSTVDTFPPPGPGAITQDADLSVFNSLPSDGVWKLYVVDDAGTDVGEIAGGWDLIFYMNTFTAVVTKTADTNDGNCSVTDCSLREAINSGVNSNVITFSSLFDTPRTITLNSMITILTNVKIIGPGSNKLTISGNNANKIFQINTDRNVELNGMTLRNGRATNTESDGGAIVSLGTLAISNSIITDNMAGRWGGAIASSKNLIITNSTFSNNSATDDGGAINARTSLKITNSTISNNSTQNEGGGVYFSGTGVIDISGTTFNGNSANITGGGITQTAGNMTIDNSTISGNSVTSDGGGIWTGGRISITNSTISGNAANTGGGIRNNSGNVTLSKSTLSGNTAGDDGGGIWNDGTMTITSSTVSRNTATSLGGGVYQFLSGVINSKNSIFANNMTPILGADFRGTINSEGYNLIKDTSSTTINGDTTGNIIGVDPMLSALGSFGGPTQTHVLLTGSPAIDKGSSSGLNTDQRGQTRPFDDLSIPNANDGADIGAFERNPGDLTCNYSLSTTSISVGAGISNGSVNVAVNAGCEWTAVSNDTWITITSGASNNGVGTTGFSVAANTGPARTGTITIAGLTVTVNQASGCVYSLSSSSTNVSNANGTGSFALTTIAACNWTASSNAGWLTVNTPTSGSGSATINFSFSANTAAARSGTITVGGRTFTVNQAAGNCPSQQPIVLGQTVNGTLQAGDCTLPSDGSFYDPYTFSGRAGQKIFAAMNSEQFDTYLVLVQGNHPGGVSIAQNDNGGGGTNARIPATSGYFTLPATGTYTILANSSTTGLTGNYNLIVGTPAQFDLDGDGKTDVGIFRPAPGEWWYLRSSDGGNRAFQFGQSTDKIVPADYTGDGKTDIAFFRPASGEWFILRSEDSSFYSFPLGISTDIPVPADYDGDGVDDPAVFRPSTATWFINKSTGGTRIDTFGANGDRPVAADYDGDGSADLAIFRPSTGDWWINRSQAGIIVTNFGLSTDKTVQADHTGDGKADVAFFRPSTGEWFVLRSENFSFYSFPFGTTGDLPVPGDYDGDGKSDAAVFRPSNNTWYMLRSTAGSLSVTFGIANDIPIPNSFVR